ncbi:MAG TPA: carboxypeptidase regulatory-like domain-containing protein, partial [Planctomycetota bacterium]|nr:carboxypeptidase regulatory-like domain-containing protein [Planctomycetota bacterium]
GRFKMLFDAPIFTTLTARQGLLRTAEVRVHLDPGEEKSVELRVPGACAVTGRVLQADGTPVAAAKVHVAGEVGEKVSPVISAPDGTFTLPLTQPDSFVLMAESKGLVTASVVQVTVSSEAPQAKADIPMLVASHLSGHVRWSTGEPVVHAMMHASAEGKSLGPGNLSLLSEMARGTYTDESGAFRVEGLHPDLPLSVSCFVSISASARVEDVQPGRDDVELVIDRATADGVTIEVEAVDEATGQPVPAYTLWHDFWNNGLHEDAKRVQVSDPDGRFQLEHCGTTVRYGFNIEAEGYARLQLGPIAPAADGAHVVARLGRTGMLHIRVLDPDGLPALGAHVFVAQAYSTAFDRFDPFADEPTQDDGRVVLDDVPPGRYVVLASGAAGASSMLRAEVASGRETNIDVSLGTSSQTGELEITARNMKGAPYRQAEVDVTWQTAYWPGRGWADAGVFDASPLTDENGYCVMQGLQPGLYWIYVSPGDTFIPPVQAQVFAGERARLDFVDER